MKLTEPTRQYMAAYGAHLASDEYVPPCPWNPFPASSPWGLEIDKRYRESVLRKRRRAALTKGE
jgi:hypothetical protein